VAGLAVLAFLPFVGSISSLPTAVLAAIVIAAVVPLVRLRPLLRLARLSRAQFFVATSTLVLTLALSPHVEQAVVIGVLLSVATHLWRELQLEVTSWSASDDLHMRPAGVLWFGTAPLLEDRFVDLIGLHPKATRLFVHLDGLGRIDTTGALVLRRLLQESREAGITVEFVDVRPRWARLVENVISKEYDPLGAAPVGG
jgi:SulP family sulfate permease